MSYALDFVAFFFSFIFSFWWAIVIPILVVVVWDKHLVTKRIAHRVGLKWVFLELQIPAEVPRTPKAMEEVLNSMHGTFRKGNWWRRYILGFIPPYYVFELVLHDGLLKFYIRCEKAFVDLVKSRIYTQYPDSKVVEVENPLKDLPEKAPDPTFDVFGTEFKLAKESSYPLRTYEVWEKLPEEQQIDPLTTLTETAAQLKADEWIVIQMQMMPIPGDSKEYGITWISDAKKTIAKLAGKSEEIEEGPFQAIGEFIKNLVLAPFKEPEWKHTEKDKNAPPSMMLHLTPGEKANIEAIERKISKHAFWSGIRYMYVARRDTFKENMPKVNASIFGMYRLFNSPDLNSLMPASESITTVDFPGHFVDERIFYRKRYLYACMMMRLRPDSQFFINVEEVASMYHVPMTLVPSSGIERKATVEKAPPLDTPLIFE